MSRLFRVLLIASLLVGLAPVLPAAAQPTLPPNCQLTPGSKSGEIYLICLPQPPVTPPWNGDLIVFAHGYVRPDPFGSLEDIFNQLILADGATLPEVATGMGYAFAMTTYSKNGLAVKEGLADTLWLIQALKQQYPQMGRVYLIGASEGGLITTLAAEQQSTPISGGLALCGPIGSFQGQINYWGDFRVLFDYFYRQALPSSPVRIPPGVMVNWEHLYVPRIAGLIANPENLFTTQQLLQTSRAPIDPADPATAVATTVGILAYNVFATNEGQDELGGQPFDNMRTVYVGSADDVALNGPRGVRRFAADEAALTEISRYYETSGQLRVPLVTMHTTGDPIVPYWHEPLYTAKTVLTGSALMHIDYPIVRYGHCTFTTEEAMMAFGTLVGMVTGGP